MIRVIEATEAQEARQFAREEFMTKVAGAGYDLHEFNPDKWWRGTEPAKIELSGDNDEGLRV